MRIADVLLADFDHEIANTQRLFDRLPEGKDNYAPHVKSMLLQKLARHIATMPAFGLLPLTSTELDMAKGFPPFPMPTNKAEFKEALQIAADELKAKLASMSDEDLQQNWVLKMGDKVFFNGSRIVAYRSMFLNHFVHHRAQLGVYLRMLDCPIPGMYGPSADEMASI